MKKKSISILLTLIFISSFYGIVQSNDGHLSNQLFKNRNIIEQARNLAQQKEKLLAAAVVTIENDQLQQQQMNDMMKAFRLKSGVAQANKFLNRHFDKSLNKHTVNTGKISGNVTVNGDLHFEQVEILVFDELGYLNGMAIVDAGTGFYEVNNLIPGKYYVLTKSRYVNEFYNDVISYDYANWRDAELVAVEAGQTTPDIDFNLNKGVLFSGKLMKNPDSTAISWQFVDFSFFDAATHQLIDKALAFCDGSGGYSFAFDKLGLFKILCETRGYEGKFYGNKASIDEATVVEVTSLNQVFEPFDFSLSELDPSSKGSISGMVLEDGTQNAIELAEVLAVNIDDPNTWGSTFSMFSPAQVGSYVIDDLPVGNYIVSAIDYVSGHLKQYYDNKEFETEATPVAVTATGNTENIDFALSKSGTISGKVTDENGTPLDSVFVVAIKTENVTSSPCELMDRFINGKIHYGMTDAGGYYEIINLIEGNYVVNSFAYLIKPGQYLDRPYHNSVHVAAGDIVANIDFFLPLAGFIQGKLVDNNSNPLTDAVEAYVFNANTQNYEFYADFKLAGDSYIISGLPTDSFKVFFDVGTVTKPYISEFYDGGYKFDLSSASAIPVVQGATTNDIDVTIDIGGIVEGTISLSNGNAVGADTLYETLIILYDLADGEYVRDKITTFCGGYRIKGIPPDDYKLCVLPLLGNNAVTYYGGGITYDDVSAQIINVQSNAVSIADITLEEATGNIFGRVVDDKNFEPMNLVYIFAYDESGHAVSAGVSGIELGGDIFRGDGIYQIGGIRNGTYYLRSWIIFALHPYFTDYLDVHYNQQSYDEWYDDILANPSPVEDSFDFYRLNFVPPFYQNIHQQATPLTISDNQPQIENIDFTLDPIEPTAIKKDMSPQSNLDFKLYQNYPNPFNPVTNIQFELNKNEIVKLSIYNILGQKVKTLFSGRTNVGVHSFSWNAEDDFGNPVANGLYYCVLKVDDQLERMKILLLK